MGTLRSRAWLTAPSGELPYGCRPQAGLNSNSGDLETRLFSVPSQRMRQMSPLTGGCAVSTNENLT